MSLRNRLLVQNVVILIATVLITSCCSLVYGYVSMRVQKLPADSAYSSEVIVMQDGGLLYSSLGISEVQAKSILMDLKMEKRAIQHKNMRYTVTSSEFKSQQGAYYQVLQLLPSLDLTGFYKNLILFVITVFLITFLIACVIAQSFNMKNIVRPVVRLKKETERLADGELDTEIAEEGDGEIRELSRTAEHLRLRLKETVFQQEKYDDNRKFLLSSISHDLKTPVTAVRGYIEGVLDGVADTPEKQRMYLQKAVDKTVLIGTMIEDLLLYSKLDLNQLPFDMERVNIRQYIAFSVEDNAFAFEREKKKLSLSNELDGEVFVSVDPKRFRRVVQNILDNARKHILEETGVVTVRLRQTSSSVIIEFADNGEGIRKEDLPHIFDRFYRADSARKIEGSSGLGLAIAKQIVNGMDGRIWATSEFGEGSSIMISLRKVKIMEAAE